MFYLKSKSQLSLIMFLMIFSFGILIPQKSLQAKDYNMSAREAHKIILDNILEVSDLTLKEETFLLGQLSQVFMKNGGPKTLYQDAQVLFVLTCGRLPGWNKLDGYGECHSENNVGLMVDAIPSSMDISCVDQQITQAMGYTSTRDTLVDLVEEVALAVKTQMK